MTVYNLFLEHIQKKADSIAVEFGDKNLTYAQLGAEVNRMASYLKDCDVKKGDIVGISLNRSTEMVISLLGIIKVGAIYLPLDPAFPPNRIQFMLEDSKCPYLITEKSTVESFGYYKGKLINVSEYKSYDVDNTEEEITEESIVYILYTSGSTGNPKGVQIRHKSLVNFLLSMKETPGMRSEDSLLAVTTLSFDISGLEIYLPLITGSKVVIASKEETVDGRLLLEKLKNVSVMQATPSTWKLLLESGWNEKLNLKALCGGEPLSKDLANKILDRVDELWNMYGPTETTIWSSCSKVEKDGIIHLGKPIRNTQFYVVDSNNQFCALGVPGELLIGGEGLSIGYLKRSDLTLEKFVDNPFDKEKNTKVYRTGDLVKINNQYQIEFLGRIDDQVKIRGFRIELGEIESAIRKSALIKEAIVIVKEFDGGDKRLIAFITVSKEASAAVLLDNSNFIADIKNRISKELPDYMVPAYFNIIDEMPLLPNGKINKKELANYEIQKTNDENRIIVKPANQFEEVLYSIWKKILGIEIISTEDNFFELGGHSILAAQIFNEFETATGIKIPLASLFRFQTIKEIVQSIQSDSFKSGWTRLIEIKKGSANKNLFLIHGAEGNVLLYRELAKYLDTDYSVFGLQARGLNGSGYISETIEEMAIDYIEAIKKVQPSGPYNMGGYCMGGTIAYEMAHQLTLNGDKVDNLFLIETYNACFSCDNIELKNHHNELIENIKFHFDNVKKLNGSDKIKFISQKAEVFKRRAVAKINSVSNSIGIKINDEPGTSKSTFKVRDINDKAQVDYAPGPYTGKTILLKPKVSYTSEPDPDFGWRDLVNGEFKVYNLDLAPRGMLVEPFVKETAAIISREINLLE